MKATCGLGWLTFSPSTKPSPSLGRSRPEPMLSRVLLPQPLGPISETTSPSAILRLTFRTAVMNASPRPFGLCAPLKRLGNRFVTLRNSSRAATDRLPFLGAEPRHLGGERRFGPPGPVGPLPPALVPAADDAGQLVALPGEDPLPPIAQTPLLSRSRPRPGPAA